MAKSTCIKCENTTFEMIEVLPKNATYKQTFVQCASCGGVVGVKDQQNAAILIQKLAEKLNVKL